MHTKIAIEKLKLRFKNKSNHPMFGKTHTNFALKQLSKPGNSNPMFGRKHSMETKIKFVFS